ncbi:unnamed protein product (macronuclear) [Paramecium tetraurelia]|uniref:Uncharacterized protein n=1 Tax=Paramecium tetraurelia TaxID=5888 RepID=A0DS88_PARTE|nr:uncharacterized protein GSPATT00019609001 [Paramecium tetraurelia]CAK85905.1 unnamed protein product [Paramecium tetraurelia]|eukprot:XP_001453302.1 hypothetical protein (macronuclear) [Paramecium tetraurelia strain d4-2]
MAQQIKLYQKQGLYYIGITGKSVWFHYINQNQYQNTFYIATYIPTPFNQYPTIIKPDYMDPLIIQNIDQQEQDQKNRRKLKIQMI